MSPPRRRKRLDPTSFRIVPDQVRIAAEADGAVAVPKGVLTAEGRAPRITVQMAAERSGWVCGVDEVVALLKAGTSDWGSLVVHALYDGDRVEAGGVALTIEGG